MRKQVMIRRRCIGLLAAFLLCGCAGLTTTTLKPTDTVRDAATAEKSATIQFQERRKASTRNPNLEVTVMRRVTQEETFQRRYVEKRKLKPGARAAFWIGGAAIAGGGFYLYDQTHWSRLGELVMGAGGLIPLGGEIITASLPPAGEEWREESRVLPPRTKPAVGVPLTVNALNSTWSDTTDEAGTVTVDVASLADSVPFGEPLEVQVTMLGEIAATEMFTVPADVVNAWRTPPVVEFAKNSAEGTEGDSILIPITISKAWHDTVTVNCSVTKGDQRSFGKYTLLLSHPVRIPNGKTHAIAAFRIKSDQFDEYDENVAFTLRDPVNARLGADTTFSYRIIDDDEPPSVQFSAPVTSGDEALSPARLPVSLSSPSGLDVSVEYSVTGGTSEGRGMDFILEAGTLSIPMGDTSANIEFPVIDDAAVEGEETILISLANPFNATLGERTSHTYIIKDNDEAEPAVPVAASGISPLTIAILDFEGIGVSAQEARVLTNRLGTHMVQLGRYQVIERGQMEQILTEQDFQMTGCTSNECAVEIGQLIGAQQMLAGSFGKLGTVYTIDMRIIDVLTGRITKTTSYDIEGSINRLLTEGLAEAVKRIAGVE